MSGLQAELPVINQNRKKVCTNIKNKFSRLLAIVLLVFIVFASCSYAAEKKLAAREIEHLRFIGPNHIPLKIMTAYRSDLNHNFVVDLIRTTETINRNGSLSQACKVLVIPTAYDVENNFSLLKKAVGEKIWKSTVEVSEKTQRGHDIWLQDWGEIAAVKTSAQTEEKLAVFDSMRQGSAGELPVDLARLWNGYYIENPSKDYSGGDNGGNIEVTPDNLLLIGNTSTLELRSFLEEKGYKDRMLVMETDWLRVGHVDEYVSIVPNPKARDGYTIVKANPRLGLQLLAKASRKELQHLVEKNHATAVNGGYEVNLVELADFLAKASSAGDGNNLAALASFQEQAEEMDGQISFSLDLSDDGDTFVDAGRLAAFAKANAALATLIDDNVKKLCERINKDKGRALNTPVSVISYPMLYHKNSRSSDHYLAMLPGVVNQVTLGRNLMIPDPEVTVFKKHIEKIGAKVGLNIYFIDASVYHLRWGDIHCGTNVFRHPNKVF